MTFTVVAFLLAAMMMREVLYNHMWHSQAKRLDENCLKINCGIAVRPGTRVRRKHAWYNKEMGATPQRCTPGTTPQRCIPIWAPDANSQLMQKTEAANEEMKETLGEYHIGGYMALSELLMETMVRHDLVAISTLHKLGGPTYWPIIGTGRPRSIDYIDTPSGLATKGKHCSILGGQGRRLQLVNAQQPLLLVVAVSLRSKKDIHENRTRWDRRLIAQALRLQRGRGKTFCLEELEEQYKSCTSQFLEAEKTSTPEQYWCSMAAATTQRMGKRHFEQHRTPAVEHRRVKHHQAADEAHVETFVGHVAGTSRGVRHSDTGRKGSGDGHVRRGQEIRRSNGAVHSVVWLLGPRVQESDLERIRAYRWHQEARASSDRADDKGLVGVVLGGFLSGERQCAGGKSGPTMGMSGTVLAERAGPQRA